MAFDFRQLIVVIIILGTKLGCAQNFENIGQTCLNECDQCEGPCHYCGAGYCCKTNSTAAVCEGVTYPSSQPTSDACFETPSGFIAKEAADCRATEAFAKDLVVLMAIFCFISGLSLVLYIIIKQRMAQQYYKDFRAFGQTTKGR